MYITARLLAHTALPSLAPLAVQADTLEDLAFLQGVPIAVVEALRAACPPVAARLHSELSQSPEIHVRKLCSSALRSTLAYTHQCMVAGMWGYAVAMKCSPQLFYSRLKVGDLVFARTALG